MEKTLHDVQICMLDGTAVGMHRSDSFIHNGVSNMTQTGSWLIKYFHMELLHMIEKSLPC